MVEPNPEYLEELRTRDRILAGDSEAATSFFDRQLDTLFEFVHYRIGRDRALAEDIVQDTMLEAVRSLGRFDGHSTLHTWLCGIAKNKIREWRRSRQPVLMEDLLEQSDSDIDAILSDVEGQPLPEWILEKRETRDLVGATLSSLPPDYRSALVGKYIEGSSVAELGKRLGKGEKATESVLSRARLAFGRVFQLLAKGRGGTT
ncbi:MAG: RNA polymerase sigma-70 factor (ECF subfamily) [Planctomycetota bacterium]|jgi:RNA polymerase sigma-70 factor (ECF subfamily)